MTSRRAISSACMAFALAAAAIGLAGCHGKSPAQSTADASPPVATVNGVPIHRDFFDFYVKGITGGKSPSELTPDQRGQALDNLIRAQVIADQAEKDGTASEPDTRHLIEISRLNVLQSVVADRYLKAREPTDQELHAEYEVQIAKLPHTEYHARHILVPTEAEAKSLIAKLEKGAGFADLAKSNSIDTSKASGGDLGWFTATGMVKPFADAVVQLKPGEYTHEPVHTQYGWHIIELEGTRDLAVPSFDRVRERLVQIVKQNKFKAYQDELMQKAKIERGKV
ncbi:MAG: peptidylprolyl isomerase [Steroidobacteraceae bacterium]